MRSVDSKGSYNHKSGKGNSSSGYCSFEFHKGNGASNGSHHRAILGSLKKSTPSKWDDAQKWVVSPSNGGDMSGAMTKPRASDAEDRRLIAPIHPKEKDYYTSGEEGGENGDSETTNQDEGETKKIDCSDSFWRADNPLEDTLPALRSVCLRDMGTEMTPIASQEPSRTGTPLRATTPSLRSPISSRSSTPGRCRQGSQARESYQTSLKSSESKSEAILFSKTPPNSWSNREREVPDAHKIFVNSNLDQPGQPNSLETRAMAWDEAERAKYMARYKREEVKIQAWENHEKRKAEKEMKRIELKADRLKSRAQERLTNKLSSTRRIAEEKRANAEAKLNERAARTSERADYIRRTGHLPSSFFPFKLPSLCW
ncbi:Remorin family protein [Cinnamomum micranthum f. kanehirae]|uniref:Remorin family protein n=1 Tax=Cinnamomum micranthum f. kanehirae TaxID=337451 RepID=A0A3S3NNH3_9MAGN|nr:Remorin family protein [Cinnamomum micranthum f. kanehirae]